MGKHQEATVDYEAMEKAASAMENDLKDLQTLCRQLSDDGTITLDAHWKGQAKDSYDGGRKSAASMLDQVTRQLMSLNGQLKKAAEIYRQCDGQVVKETGQGTGGGGGGGRF